MPDDFLPSRSRTRGSSLCTQLSQNRQVSFRWTSGGRLQSERKLTQARFCEPFFFTSPQLIQRSFKICYHKIEMLASGGQADHGSRERKNLRMRFLSAWRVIPPFGEEDPGPRNSFIPFSTSAVTNMECWLQADTQVMVAERRKTYQWRSLLLHQSFHPFAKKNLEPGTHPSYFQARLSQNWDVSFRRTSR